MLYLNPKLKKYPALSLCVGILLFSSCSISKMAMNKLTDSLTSSSSTTFTGDDDPELIRDALPFTIKFYESLLAKDSTNAALYLATAKLLCFYAQFFIAAPIDTMQDQVLKKNSGKRARKLFLRAREYSLKCIDIMSPGLANIILKGSLDSAMNLTTANIAPPLFWTAAAWLGAIASDRTDFSLALSIKKPISIAKKIIDLDTAFNEGAAHELLGVSITNIPASLGGGIDIAETYFTKALSLSNKSRVSTFVLYASSVPEKKGNREQYVSLLNEALAIDIKKYPSNKLQNIIYHDKAKRMLDDIGKVFPDTVMVPLQ